MATLRAGGCGRNAVHYGWARPVALLALILGLAGCAGMRTSGSDPDDLLEPANRVVFDVNLALDGAIIKPAAKAYRAVFPPFVRDRFRNVVDNLAEPRVWVNDILQGRFNSAGITFTRFLVNTVGGIAGMFDLATERGFPRQSGDFGQTLYAWGFPDGPYLVLLFFGPSNLRDAFGLGVDLATTPPALVAGGNVNKVAKTVTGIVDGLDLRARNIETLDQILASALDPYANLKSLVRQQRRAELREARGLNAEPIEELIDPGAPPP